MTQISTMTPLASLSSSSLVPVAKVGDATPYNFDLTKFNVPTTNLLFTQEGAIIYRLGDRVATGGATVSDFAFPNVQQDWLSQFQVAAGLSTGAVDSSHLIALTNNDAGSAVGILGGAQSLHFTNSGTNAIANSAYAVNNNATLSTNAWGFYCEAHKTSSAAGPTYAAEHDTRSLVATITPNPNQQGDVIGLQLASGAGLSASGQFDCSAAIQICPNPMKWKVGINFLSGALTTTSGSSNAILMAPGQKVSWHDGSNNETMYMDGQVILSRNYTVSGLPVAATALKGARAFATDLSGGSYVYGAAAAGGGSRGGPVFCDGSSWREG